MIPSEATQKDILHLSVGFKTVILFASELLVKAERMCWWSLSIKIQMHLVLFKKRVAGEKNKLWKGNL